MAKPRCCLIAWMRPSGTFQRPAAGPYQISEVFLGIIDAFPQRIHLLYEPVPLVFELS